jgi:hypothetical protein
MKIKLSKSQWEFIGNKTGWIKTAKDIHEMYVSFVDDLLFEDNQDIRVNIEEGVKPENIWIISYDNDAINDMDLFQSIYDQTWGKGLGKILFYKEFLKACSMRAINYKTNIPKSSEELIGLIEETNDIDKWWDFIKQNQSIYQTERDIEERQMKFEG